MAKKKFYVEVRRVSHADVSVTVEADNKEDAKLEAEEKVKRMDLSTDYVDYEIHDVRRIK
jgi:hypothetical protein